MRTAIAIAALLAALAAGCGSSGDSGGTSSAPASDLAPVTTPYAPTIEPADFVATVDNPYFPLRPGTVFHYRGVQEDGRTPLVDVMTVTSDKKRILGVDATVVRDVVFDHGEAVEKTLDWYAQDKGGNVWYLGEDTRGLHNGRYVKAEDSWQAGVNGAEPGIIMPGRPAKGERYRQEYYPGHALDQAEVLGGGGPLTVPAGFYKSTLLTVETAPRIDPGVRENKYYAAGVGDVKEQTVAGNQEQISLVRITH